MKDGTVAGLYTPDTAEYLEPSFELWDLRSEFPDPWKMLVLTIYPDGKSELEFKYEYDPGFFES
jgi:hypothetical protein